jgi:peptidoglycan/LPS O-acetylase OafA/YrhL
MMVLFTHAYPLGGFGREPIDALLGGQESFGSLAVIGFFVISGFLVTHSLLYSYSYKQYFIKRALRIFPAFWVCLIITAFVFAPFAYFIEFHTLGNFFGNSPYPPITYVTSNFLLLMHQYRIDNIFAHNPDPYTFDSSLWTLFLEAKAYILLAVIGLLGALKKRQYIVFITFFSLFIILLADPIIDTSNKFVRLIWDKDFLFYTTYFIAGTILFIYRKYIPLNKYLFITLITVALTAFYFHLLHQILTFIAPYMVIWLALTLPLQQFTKYGDFSYGIYIYAYPIQQLLIIFHLNNNLYIYFLLEILVTLLLAITSWYLIESPALNLKKRFKKL